MYKRFLFGFAVVLASVGCGPIGPTPGLAIGGEALAVPADFAFVQDHDLILIRTYMGGWLPQVHTIWGVGNDGGIYAIAVPGASWRERLRDDADVLIRVGDGRYTLTAAPVDDPQESQQVFTLYMQKYGPQLAEILGREATIEDMSDLIRFTGASS